jgi:hypothetical protein
MSNLTCRITSSAATLRVTDATRAVDPVADGFATPAAVNIVTAGLMFFLAPVRTAFRIASAALYLVTSKPSATTSNRASLITLCQSPDFGKSVLLSASTVAA